MKGRSPGSPGSLKRSNAVLDVVPPLKRQNAQEFGENLCQRDDSSANAATGGSVSSLCLPIHALPATAEYERMLSWDLKEECRHRGLRIGGSNAFMVNRLRAYDAAMSNNRELYNTPLASDDSDNKELEDDAEELEKFQDTVVDQFQEQQEQQEQQELIAHVQPLTWAHAALDTADTFPDTVMDQFQATIPDTIPDTIPRLNYPASPEPNVESNVELHTLPATAEDVAEELEKSQDMMRTPYSKTETASIGTLTPLSSQSARSSSILDDPHHSQSDVAGALLTESDSDTGGEGADLATEARSFIDKADAQHKQILENGPDLEHLVKNEMFKSLLWDDIKWEIRATPEEAISYFCDEVVGKPWCSFKCGITTSPELRMHTGDSHSTTDYRPHDKDWSRMFVIYAGEGSVVGALEAQIINMFKSDDRCSNINPGGEQSHHKCMFLYGVANTQAEQIRFGELRMKETVQTFGKKAFWKETTISHRKPRALRFAS